MKKLKNIAVILTLAIAMMFSINATIVSAIVVGEDTTSNLKVTAKVTKTPTVEGDMVVNLKFSTTNGRLPIAGVIFIDFNPAQVEYKGSEKVVGGQLPNVWFPKDSGEDHIIEEGMQALYIGYDEITGAFFETNVTFKRAFKDGTRKPIELTISQAGTVGNQFRIIDEGEFLKEYEVPQLQTNNLTIKLPDITVNEVTGPASVKAGESVTYTSKVNNTIAGESTDITWSLDGNKATGTSIDAATGKLTVAADETNDTVTVVATSKADATKKQTKTVTIAKSNSWKTPLAINNWMYGTEASKPTATPTHGNVEYTYSDTKEGTYTATVPTLAGTHYVKAAVKEGTGYQGLVSEPVEFKITKSTDERAMNKVIEKANASIKEINGKEVAFGNPLSSITLPEGWQWVHPDQVIGEPEKARSAQFAYPAMYEVDDVNYDWTDYEFYDDTLGALVMEIEIKEVPKTPETPETPVTPDNPGTPENPEITVPPETPGTVVVPEVATATPGNKEETKVTNTGDTTNVWQWVGMLGVAGITLIYASKKTKRVK